MRHFWMGCKLFSRFFKEKFWLEKGDFPCYLDVLRFFEPSPGIFLFFLPWIGGCWLWFWFGEGFVFFSIGFILRWEGGRQLGDQNGELGCGMS